jgi:hypothetical protein
MTTAKTKKENHKKRESVEVDFVWERLQLKQKQNPLLT